MGKLLTSESIKIIMRIRLIYPRCMKFLEANKEIDSLLEKHKTGDYTMPPSLALPIIASITPSDIEVNLTDVI